MVAGFLIFLFAPGPTFPLFSVYSVRVFLVCCLHLGVGHPPLFRGRLTAVTGSRLDRALGDNRHWQTHVLQKWDVGILLSEMWPRAFQSAGC